MKWYMVVLFGMASMYAQDTFIEEEAPKKVTALSKARREAIDQLEVLAHAITKNMQQEVALLDDIMRTVRAVTEGNKKNCFMKSLQSDRAALLAELSKSTEEISIQQQVTAHVHTVVTRGVMDKKKK